MKRQSETAVVHSAPADGGSGGGKSLHPAGDASGAGGDITNTLGEEAPPNAPRLRVRIKRYHAVAKWSWNVGGGTGSMASLSLVQKAVLQIKQKTSFDAKYCVLVKWKLFVYASGKSRCRQKKCAGDPCFG